MSCRHQTCRPCSTLSRSMPCTSPVPISHSTSPLLRYRRALGSLASSASSSSSSCITARAHGTQISCESHNSCRQQQRHAKYTAHIWRADEEGWQRQRISNHTVSSEPRSSCGWAGAALPPAAAPAAACRSAFASAMRRCHSGSLSVALQWSAAPMPSPQSLHLAG